MKLDAARYQLFDSNILYKSLVTLLQSSKRLIQCPKKVTCYNRNYSKSFERFFYRTVPDRAQLRRSFQKSAKNLGEYFLSLALIGSSRLRAYEAATTCGSRTEYRTHNRENNSLLQIIVGQTKSIESA